MISMKSPLSCSDIEVLIHCHVSPIPHPRRHAPAVRDALGMFQTCEMIEPVLNAEQEEVFNLTHKGRSFIRAICNVREGWVLHGKDAYEVA